MKNIIKSEIDKEKRGFDLYFKGLLDSYLTNSYLDKVMLYSVINGGKRIRPYLIKEFSKIKQIPTKQYYQLSAVIEIIHSYSLIHDDLPSMDNDDFRRGKLSTHKKFNEAQAILAGDSLHDLAFEILSDLNIKRSNITIKLINLLSKSLGSSGLAGGQSLDLLYENKNIPTKDIVNMYKLKTGGLFKFCCVAPFIISKSNKSEINFASNYGETFGLVFQIVDDYMDYVSTKKKIGKTPKKDLKQNKSTIHKNLKSKNIKKFCISIVNNFENKNIFYIKKWSKLKNLLFYLISQLD